MISGLAIAAGAYIGFSFYPHPEMDTAETIMLVQAEANRRVEKLGEEYFADVPKSQVEQIVGRSVLSEMRDRYHMGRQMLMTAGAAVLLVGCALLLSTNNRILGRRVRYLLEEREADTQDPRPTFGAARESHSG